MRPIRAGDRVHDGAGARGTVLRVDTFVHTDNHLIENVFVDWRSTAVLEPSPDALPDER